MQQTLSEKSAQLRAAKIESLLLKKKESAAVELSLGMELAKGPSETIDQALNKNANKKSQHSLSEPISSTEFAVDIEINPRAEAHNTQWSAEAYKNITWFINNEQNLPREPYILDETTLLFSDVYEPKKELKINNPQNFYRTLKADIAIGPNGWNSMTGVLPNRLKLLRDFVERNNEKT